MIDLRTSEFTSIVPENLSSQTEVQAIAYALGRQIEAICGYADHARIYAAMPLISEEALDLLAEELRTPAYDESYSVPVKRELVEGTLQFYMTIGTPYAVNKVIAAIFDNGRIQEWFEYGGDPYHYKMVIDVTEQGIEHGKHTIMVERVRRCKNLRSWLDGIEYEAHSNGVMNAFGGHEIHREMNVWPLLTTRLDSDGTAKTSAGSEYAYSQEIYPNEQEVTL